MKDFGFSDVVLATVVTSRGDRVSVRVEGVDSMQAVYGAVRKAVSALFGVMTLTVRNLTRGWSHSECIYKRGSVSLAGAGYGATGRFVPAQPVQPVRPVQLQFAF